MTLGTHMLMNALTQIKIPASNFNLQIVMGKFITRVFECKILVMLYAAVRCVHTGGDGITLFNECRTTDLTEFVESSRKFIKIITAYDIYVAHAFILSSI